MASNCAILFAIFAKFLINPSKYSQILLKLCQSGEISPNLVTLVSYQNHYHLEEWSIFTSVLCNSRAELTGNFALPKAVHYDRIVFTYT